MEFLRAAQGITMGMVLLAVGCAPKADPEIPWWDSFPLALEAAAVAQKPVLVYFNADWCTICKQVERESFSNAAVSEAMLRFIAVKVDIDRQPWLAEKYQIDAVPAYVKLDSAGTRRGYAIGYKSPEEMEQLLHNWATKGDSP
jgi:thiol:disulfide interchange protein